MPSLGSPLNQYFQQHCSQPDPFPNFFVKVLHYFVVLPVLLPVTMYHSYPFTAQEKFKTSHEPSQNFGYAWKHLEQSMAIQ